jgi:catechol 2,3-dioxygenase
MGDRQVRKLENAALRVRDIGEALSFHRDMLGLTELGRDGDTVYLGAGLDENYDVALSPGGTGVTRLALSVSDSDELARLELKVEAGGLAPRRSTDSAPGHTESVHFSLPNDTELEIVVMKSHAAYLHPTYPIARRGQGIAPRDFDHINLLAPDVQAMHDIFVEVLEFSRSDLFCPASGVLAGCWLRCGEYHHDIAIMQASPEQSLHHVAWTLDSFDHLKTAADILAQDGIRLEWGPGRHGVAGNLSEYFQVPGGNRYELCAEMPRLLDPNREPGITSDQDKLLTAWGQQPSDPESYWQGS